MSPLPPHNPSIASVNYITNYIKRGRLAEFSSCAANTCRGNMIVQEKEGYTSSKTLISDQRLKQIVRTKCIHIHHVFNPCLSCFAP